VHSESLIMRITCTCQCILADVHACTQAPWFQGLQPGLARQSRC
jgi:hypothetical protein